jgi:hypothetical protein
MRYVGGSQPCDLWAVIPRESNTAAAWEASQILTACSSPADHGATVPASNRAVLRTAIVSTVACGLGGAGVNLAGGPRAVWLPLLGWAAGSAFFVGQQYLFGSTGSRRTPTSS